MKKVIVIGAGISGLVAAIYAKRSGFDVTIYERHILPGGLSTSWKRGDYVFEGGMHWLGGSIPENPLHEIWLTTGAIGDLNKLHFREPFYTILKKDDPFGDTVSVRRNLDTMIAEFLRYAPEDKKAIKKLRGDIKACQAVHSQLNDLLGLKVRTRHRIKIRDVIKMIPAGIRFPYLSKTTIPKYLSRFKNEDLKALLRVINHTDFNSAAMLFTLSTFASGDGAYPEGGSFQMAKNMAKTFEDLGGKIIYNSEISKIIVKDKVAQGVVVNGQTIDCDAVICSKDLMSARSLFDESELPKSQIKIFDHVKENAMPVMSCFFSYGIKADLSKYPKGIVISLPEGSPFKIAGQIYPDLRINNYAEYRDINPEGKTAVTCLLLGDTYDYWKAAKEDGTYKQKKDEYAKKLLEILEDQIPEIKGNVEVIDVATPLTYERYTHAYHGSWMTIWSVKSKLNSYKEKSKVKNLYFTGERISLSGGLPVAGTSGFKAAQYLCRDFNMEFV